jgi:hypothetical protein
VENMARWHRQEIIQITFEKLKLIGEGWVMNDGVVVSEGASSRGGYQMEIPVRPIIVK